MSRILIYYDSNHMLQKLSSELTRAGLIDQVEFHGNGQDIFNRIKTLVESWHGQD